MKIEMVWTLEQIKKWVTDKSQIAEHILNEDHVIY